MMNYNDIVFKAGKRALAVIRDEGLSPDRVSTIAGAAGGPKWLILGGFDRVIASLFLKTARERIFLVGSSIGAWRFAAIAQKEPLKAINAFEDAYIDQHYSPKPGPEEVTAESYRIMDAYLSKKGIAEVLSSPSARMSMLSVRCKHLTADDRRSKLGAGLACAAAGNFVSRKALSLFFERTLFHDPRETPPLGNNGFTARLAPLSQDNFRQCLMASGSIPLVMEGVRAIPGAPAGTYRDGGLIDYHLDLPLAAKDKITLFPHYLDRIIPGWFDKQIPWRKPHGDYISDTLLIAPSPEFVKRLPFGKIPDRDDFYFFNGRDRERIAYWRGVTAAAAHLAWLFHEAVESGAIRTLVRPL